MDIDYLEGLMNCDAVGSVHCTADSYNFNVGDVVLDIEKNSFLNETVENTNLTEDYSTVDNRCISEERQYAANTIDNSQVFEGANVVNNPRLPDGGNTAPAGVTVNFNAYNEIHSPATDVDSVMSAFGEKLAEAVALAAEGVHL